MTGQVNRGRGGGRGDSKQRFVTNLWYPFFCSTIPEVIVTAFLKFYTLEIQFLNFELCFETEHSGVSVFPTISLFSEAMNQSCYRGQKLSNFQGCGEKLEAFYSCK